MALGILKCKFKLLSHTRNLSWGEDLHMKSETINVLEYIVGGLLCSSAGKESIYNAEDPASILGSERSPGAGNDNPLQYSCLETEAAWWATVHGVAKSRTRLRD